MAQVGISIRVDVTKIDKSRLYEGEKGTYLDLTTFVDLDKKDQYDNNGFISQSTTKEERQSGLQTPILGNVRVFYSGDNSPAPQSQPQPASPQAGADYGQGGSEDSDIPF
jgi:hypothetical protein